MIPFSRVPPTLIKLPRHRFSETAARRLWPDGDAVVLEEQTAKAAQTALDFQLTSNLYRKYLGMVRIALGNQN